MANTGGIYTWSTTASSNATADSTVNWAEGMAPSAVNDSARAMMASAAKYNNDISGAIVTGGSSTAYTVSSNQVFDTLAHLSGQMIAFTPHTTSGATVTLNVDSLGAKPLRSAPSVELPAGILIQGTPYVATYNNSDGAFYLQGFFGNPYNVPIGSGIDYYGTSAPNTSFAFPVGQAISRSTYSTLFGILTTTYGAGDGSTTFNLPDVRGRVRAAIDNLGGTSSNRLLNGSMSGARNQPGGAGGADTVTLTASQIPTITSSGTNSITVSLAGGNVLPFTSGVGSNTTITPSGTIDVPSSNNPWTGTNSISGSNSISVTSNNTGSQSHDNLQPMILCCYIMRII